MLPHLGFLYMDSGEWTQVLILANQCLLTEVSWDSHSTAFASVENQVKIVAEVLSPPAASSNLRTHPRLCAHATNYQNHPSALFLKTRDWKLISQLNWDPAFCLSLLISSSAVTSSQQISESSHWPADKAQVSPFLLVLCVFCPLPLAWSTFI